MTFIIKSESDVKEFLEKAQFGDTYLIDVFPVDPEAFLKTETDTRALKKKLQDMIENHFSKNVEVVDNFEKLRRDYPNISSLRRLKESEIVSLGLSLGIEGVDINLPAPENDDIVIEWFKKNVWIN